MGKCSMFSSHWCLNIMDPDCFEMYNFWLKSRPFKLLTNKYYYCSLISNPFVASSGWQKTIWYTVFYEFAFAAGCFKWKASNFHLKSFRFRNSFKIIKIVWIASFGLKKATSGKYAFSHFPKRNIPLTKWMTVW